MDPFSFPQRVVLLIDLHPLLHPPNPNPNSYITPILTSVTKLLSFPPLSSSLFSYSLFFSSLSPFLSESKLRSHLLPLSSRPPPSSLLSFNRPSQTLASLSQTLTSLSHPPPADPVPSPNLQNLARFLLRLEHDYSWEPAARKANPQPLTARPNLVLLFSPVYPDYVDRYEPLDKILELFCPVSEKFGSLDIHFSWVDVNFDGHSSGERLGLGFLERGIRELNWGFYSTDAILLGSALVPFRLLFPYIGCTMPFRADGNVMKSRVELVLGITDVSGEPLQCKSCDLEAVALGTVGQRSDLSGLFSGNHDGHAAKICVRKVWRKDEGVFLLKSCGLVLLRGASVECRKHSVEHPTEPFFADRVLELLCAEKGEFAEGKPIWQLLLAFLFNNNYWALVSISDSDGKSLDGILKPFTVNYALLSIIVKNSLSACPVVVKDGVESSQSALSRTKDNKRKRSKAHKKLVHDVTWSSFYKAVVSQDSYVAPGRDLCELYFSMECKLSKKLRFLKCWMKQIQKSDDCCQFKLSEPDDCLNVNEEEVIVECQKDPELHIPSPGERHLSGPANEKLLSFSCLEDVDAFIGSIPQKIEHGLNSEEVDLWHLARRLVGISVDAFYFKFGMKSMEDLVSEEAKDVSNPNVATEVSHLLLLRPKDLISKYKSLSSASLTSDQSIVPYNTVHKIREHELQILFRMEMLKMELSATLEENAAQKTIKEICSLLENIEFSLQGDSFAGESLLDFAGRTIKSRYSDSLGDTIREIYEYMEFFSFDENEVDAPDSLPASNSDEPHRVEDENHNAPKDASSSAATVSHNLNTIPLQEDDANRKVSITANVHEVMLLEAQKQRERARRLASFTSWVPDLHRVWACKQPRTEKPMHESLTKFKSKRRKRRESKGEMVCETPLTGKKHHHMQQDSCRILEATYSGSNPRKALFQHIDSDGSSSS